MTGANIPRMFAAASGGRGDLLIPPDIRSHTGGHGGLCILPIKRRGETDGRKILGMLHPGTPVAELGERLWPNPDESVSRWPRPAG